MMIGRTARTLRALHPVQIAWRLPHAASEHIRWAISASGGPRLATEWPPPPASLRRLVEGERVRARERLGRLPGDSHLRAYEACYGLELGAAGRDVPAAWPTSVALEPYPASIRARALAVAVRFGRHDVGEELTRAARAVLLQPELHLLGNHVLENGLALVCAAAVTRGPESDAWRRMGIMLLTWQMPKQFLPDGGHVERSASYHLALTAGLLECLELAESSRRPLPTIFRGIAERALGWVSVVEAPDGTYPLFNDAALDAAPCISDVVALGADLGIRPSRVVRERRAGDLSTTRLESTGWVRIDARDATVIIDAGPDATGFQPGHTHADGLGFEAWIRGERAVVDFGVASYEAGPQRDETRATRSHNTVEVGGQNSCEVWGAFRVGRRGRGRVVASGLESDVAWIQLHHDGYTWLPGRPRHVRVVTVRGGTLEVHDRVTKANVSCTSRLRLDRVAGERLKVVGTDRRFEDRWYPRHGSSVDADVHEQPFEAGDAGGARWRIEW